MPTAEEHLDRAARLLDEALTELEAAKDDVEPYALGSLRFLRAEVKATIGRIESVLKAIGPKPPSTPAA